jgi:hypothetical protein
MMTDTVKPLFDNARAFYDHVTAESLAGKYPAAEFNPGHDVASCKYRTPDGRQCVVGCTFPDAEYKPGMEGASCDGLYENYPRLVDYIPPGMTQSDMYHAQRAHDRTANESMTGTGLAWEHDRFVVRLREWVPAFKGF